MSDLGIVLNKAASGDRALQNADAFSLSNSRLYDFLARTSDTSIAANVIDPLCTFDVEFKFYPDLFDTSKSELYYGNTGSQDTFLYSLAKRLLASSAHGFGTGELILQLGSYVQSMAVPQMVMPEAGKVPTLFGEFPVNNLYVKPDNNTITLTILNTKVSLHDFLFYPWMREVTMPIWSYSKQPYTTADITVKFDKHCNTRYVFCGCRPSQIQSRQPNQEPEGSPSRDVTMLFDYMFISEASSGETSYSSAELENALNTFTGVQNIKTSMSLS